MAKAAPWIADEHGPRTRSLTEDEQDDLVEAAFHGLSCIEDAIESSDDHRHATALQERLDRLNTLLTKTTEPDAS
ncbi:MAG: hypothetical protein M3017_05595 [Actinomycetota bacterium]|nr:hypothetical protein [Actinomycetota bacterium]